MDRIPLGSSLARTLPILENAHLKRGETTERPQGRSFEWILVVCLGVV
jgi:hypothetical protein